MGDTNLMRHLLSASIGADTAASHGVTHDVCDLARLAVASRAFAVQLPDALTPDADSVTQPALLPVIDLANHDLPQPNQPLSASNDVFFHNLKAMAAERTTHGMVQLGLRRPAVAGQAVSNSYGVKANARMMLHYGFTIPWVGKLTCLAHGRLVLASPG